MKNVTFNIPDMQSAHCQTRVRTAVNAIPGAQILNQEAGKISVDLETEDLENKVVTAIEQAGYSVEPGA